MELTQSLKSLATDVIKLTEQLGDQVGTWANEPSAPQGGFTDRAGFVYYKDVELFADINASDDGLTSQLRARLAKVDTNELNEEFFNIITLDFNTDYAKTKSLIDDTTSLTQNNLIDLLNDEATQPKYIQVSLNSRTDDSGEKFGTRFEYEPDELHSLTVEQQAALVAVFEQTYKHIVDSIQMLHVR